MSSMKRYLELKKECENKGVDSSALSQYLHISQVMEIEEKSYRKHRKEMNDWLHNIEKTIQEEIRRQENSIS